MLYNNEFLKKLDEHRTRIIYARIVALTLDEIPIESIEGRVTQGSINIDGDSAVRRTCSLTLVAHEFDYNAFIWGLNTKFTLEIGLENMIDSNYPDIIWFKQGTYFISQFSTSHATNNFNISISGKDKMCALNGEIGGSLTSSIDFGTVEDIITLDDGSKSTKITKLTLKDIIRNVVHLYGGEPLHNIIINDLDISGLELLEYRYDTPMYLYKSISLNHFENVTLDGNKQCEIWKVTGVDESGNDIIVHDYSYIDNEGNKYAQNSLESDIPLRHIVLSDLTVSELEMLVNPMTGTKTPCPIKMDNQLWHIAKVSYGETAGYRFTDLTYPGDLIGGIGEALTSILDKIKNMLGEYEYFYDLDGHFVFQRKQTAVQIAWSPEDEQKNRVSQDDEVAYVFKGGELVTTFNNNPNLGNLKNDYSVWGQRNSISGQALPVHMRYAIDLKPTYYKAFDGTVYTSDTYDWRELIYQMAKDYYAHNTEDDFAVLLTNNNLPYYPLGKTGYENYYTDLLGFWRDLYDPSDTRDLNIYYGNAHIHKYWNKIVYEAPQNLNFWFDFLDAENHLSQYSVKNVGCRPKAINDSNVKAIYFRETPNIIFTTDYDKDASSSSTYTYINAANAHMNTMFSISSQGKSAKVAIDDLLYQHGYCIESTTINTVPIYYLEPNSRIHVLDEKTKIDGYYNVSKLSIPLTYNGTMSITATKAAENI